MRVTVNEQRRLMRLRWLRHLPAIPLPIRVPHVGWWLARNDVCGQSLVLNAYEKQERVVVESMLAAGMTVLDIGAHHGVYTLLASRKVGPNGRVLAFEPSVRERNRLIKHLRLNRCRNVQVQSVALGSKPGWAELFVVEEVETGCNCLQVPRVSQTVTGTPVFVDTLDNCLLRRGIDRVDFMKLDVEGAELEVLKGAGRLLKRADRPIILAEVEDIRTAAWGYQAREIVEFLRQYDYRWFRLANGHLCPVETDCSSFNENLLGLPVGRQLPFEFCAMAGA
jgi:FkbM family methyltransferase